jgi:hypothetical protein
MTPLGPLALAAALAAAAPPGPAGPEPSEVLATLTKAWAARDAAAYLVPWQFESPQAEAEERAFASTRLADSGAESHLALHAPRSVPAEARGISCYGELVTVRGPWGRVEQVVVRLEKRQGRWTPVSRRIDGQLEGLAHLSLDPAGLAVSGHVLRLPDFQLEMTAGTLFSSPEELGKTVLVFVGTGRVRFNPGPVAEREQLRKYLGRPAMDAELKLALIRVAPEEVDAVLTGPPLKPDPLAATRWPAARRFYDDHIDGGYVLDASVPGSPWWTMPPPGDAMVVFDFGDAPLTLSVSSGSAEGISLFNRNAGRQICLYPKPGRRRDFDDEDGRRVDLLHTDLELRLEPGNDTLTGEAALQLAFLGGVGNLRLRLNNAYTIESISSGDGARRHLFFRLRRQNGVIVALGPLSDAEKATLVIRYRGNMRPPAFERESMGRDDEPLDEDFPFKLHPPTVFAQPNAWYPQLEIDDFATATIEVDHPAGETVVGPGRRTTVSAGGGRTITRMIVDEPVKTMALAMGQLVAAGQKEQGGVTLSLFTVPRLKGEGVRALQTAGALVQLFTEEFGPSPYRHIQLLLFEAEKPGGHSPPGLVLLAQRPPIMRKKLRPDPGDFSSLPGFFLAHELAHQWWGDGVSPRSYHDRWISEAFAHYAAALWIRRAQGEQAFRELMREMARWALEKNDAGPIWLGHRIGHLEKDSKLFRAIVYDKGACVLHLLRQTIGDEAFRRGLTEFQQTFQFRKVGTQQLAEALSEVAGLDLRPYFESWIYGTELPTLSLTSQTEAAGARFATTIRLDAQQLPGPMPVEVTLMHAGRRETHPRRLAPGRNEWEIETDYRPERVRIEENSALLARLSD